MTSRALSFAAAICMAAVAIVYLSVMTAQDDSPAAWFVVLLAAGVCASVAAALADQFRRPFAITATAAIAVAALISIASVGLLLLPAVVASGLALVRRKVPAG